MVGDAFAFIDPVFSTGVHLATYSALLAGRSINTCLDNGFDEQRCFTEFEVRYRNEYAKFYQYLVAFYDTNREKEGYFWAARNILNSEERDNEAFVRLVAGVSSGALKADSQVFFDTRQDLGHTVQSLIDNRDSLDDLGISRTDDIDAYSDRFCFLPGFEYASLKGTGLIPTADGFRWCEGRHEAGSE